MNNFFTRRQGAVNACTVFIDVRGGSLKRVGVEFARQARLSD
jgi:hypothetical protein